MNFMHVLVSSTAAFLIRGAGAANAGQTINEAGALACVTDKWDEKEVEKGHKLVDYAGRCVIIPDDPSAPKYTEDCVESTNSCPMRVIRAAGPAPSSSSKLETR